MFAESYACIDKNTFELTGFIVRRLDLFAYTFFVVVSTRNIYEIQCTLSVTTGPELLSNHELAFVELPPFSSPSRAFTDLACAELRAPRFPKSIAHTSTIASERVFHQWAILAFLNDFGIRLQSAKHTIVLDLKVSRTLTTTEPPFDTVPRADSFQIDDSAWVPERERLPIRTERYGATHYEQVIKLMQGDHSGAFDEDDLQSLDAELKLSIRGDLLAAPLSSGHHLYASSEYWIGLAIGSEQPVVQAFIGLLTFYQVRNECWMGYLYNFGAIMTEMASRRARQRGYNFILVWTTSSNMRAQTFYQNVGFVVARDIFPSDHHGATDECIVFRLSIA